MEALKKQRKALRAAFTKVHTSFTSKIEGDFSKEEKLIAFQLLENKMAELDAVHANFNKVMFESQMKDEDIAKEMESDDGYKATYLAAKIKITDFLEANSGGTPAAAQLPGTSQPLERKTVKYPPIELFKFNGNVKEWLTFWSVFKKVHEDPLLRKEDKFYYLVQSTVPESRAYDLVCSFPPTAENYDKAIKSLKNRFGRDDIIVEFYVRELLGLVLQNAIKGRTKVPLASIYDKLESHIRALDTLGVTTDKCAAMLYPLVESSLPEDVLRAWQRSGMQAVDASGQPETKDRLEKLLEFLQREVENQERIDMALQGFRLATEDDEYKQRDGEPETLKDVASASALLTSTKEERQVQCVFCKRKHDSQDCEVARTMSLADRKECARKEDACYKCAKRGHIALKCKTRGLKCGWCEKRHILLFCPTLPEKDNAPNKLVEKKTIVENNLATLDATPQVCLQTLRVKIYSDSKEKVARAIIDTGSQRSYIRADLANELGYVSHGDIEIEHSLFGGVKPKASKHDKFLVRLKNLEGSYACNFSVLSQNKICDTIPSIKRDSWVEKLHKQKIVLSDVGNEQNSIDILIGADVAGKLFTGNKFELCNGLTALETLLGWTVMGKVPDTYSDKCHSAILCTSMFVQEADISDLWRLDILGISDPIQNTQKSDRDQNTRNFIMETSKLTACGRYEVNLPWKADHAPLSENRDIAFQRLKSTIDKIDKQGLRFEYNKVFENWLSESIIERVPENEIGHMSHYLPHRPVLKMNSTTKIRPVFDASANKRGYPSLNQCLEKGPNLMELVPSSINRFREREIGVISDIKGAFLQIGISPGDRDFLRFLWSVDGEIVVFRHCRVVFGLSCSPFLLSATIELLLEAALIKSKRDGEWTENSVKKLKESFYVDNCVNSVDCKDDLEVFTREATAIMASGGFDLRGWESSGDFSETESTLVLGISWDKRKDSISINPAIVMIEAPKLVTKRIILSATHKIFDPIGFTCPVSLQPRILLTQLWAEKVDWDEKIDEEKSNEFYRWLNGVPLLKEIELPRRLGEGKLSIHAFGDASGLAYAAVVYARVETENFVNIQLLSARARIAPKKATIPRLELMAATIAARLTSSVLKSLTRRVGKVTYWSDSTTVLAWLKRDTQWGTFVYNRVKEIKALCNASEWRYIPGDLNPADLPSRGCSPSQLVESEWWLGPEWLRYPECDWPSVKRNVDENEIKREVKRSVLVNMIDIRDPEFKASNLFASYTKLIRFIAWVRRFLKNRKSELAKRKTLGSADLNDRKISSRIYLPKEERKRLYLTFKEIKEAEVSLLRCLQNVMFENLYKNKLSSFKTLLDKNGLHVIKTKILNRNDDDMFLSPILLDKHDIVTLLVREIHEKCGHSGTQIVMNTLRERFWIIALRQIVRSVASKCVTCKKYKAKHMECESPPLPVNRVRDSTVFEVTGIDFAGPVFIKGGGKGWICIFTCAVYRAVHFELASALSVEGFIECLRRFISRRGRPRYIYCDNGTNFVGTANALEGLDWEKIIKEASIFQIEWHFNPPSAPWWGGWWERLVGILKTILRKILGKASLSYESLTTSLCDAEAIMNSRPLTYVSDDPEDLKPLTPAMFLQEIQEVGVPDLDMLYNHKLNEKYKYRQKILNDLRVRFRTEYLSQLMFRGEKKETRKIKVGDIVLIGDDIHKRIDWPLARVVEVIAGRDGNARVYILKTKNGLLKRAIQRIYPLEIDQNNSIFEDLNTKAKDKTPEKILSKSDLKMKCARIEKTKDCNAKNELNLENKEKIVNTRSGRMIKKPSRYD